MSISSSVSSKVFASFTSATRNRVISETIGNAFVHHAIMFSEGNAIALSKCLSNSFSSFSDIDPSAKRILSRRLMIAPSTVPLLRKSSATHSSGSVILALVSFGTGGIGPMRLNASSASLSASSGGIHGFVPLLSASVAAASAAAWASSMV